MISFSKEDRGTESPESAVIGCSPSPQWAFSSVAGKLECGGHRSQRREFPRMDYHLG